MISGLHVVGFKRFSDVRLGLSPLTVLTGLNGSGKSSVIHALLLAREASQAQGAGIVRLNGPFGLELGTAEDVRNWVGADAISVVVTEADASYEWTFAVPSSEALHLRVASLPSAVPTAFSRDPRTFTYLCAERLGPRTVLGSSSFPDEAVEVGVRGEYCAEVIDMLGGRPLSDARRRHPASTDADAGLLKYEVERWLGEIARRVELDADTFPGTGVTTLRYRFPGGIWVRAPNMGFGVTYALPIVLGGLIAARDSLLVVENPEAHLHPAGQSRMGIFLAWLAGKGVQVLVETHSDHILNGIRRAVGELGLLEHQQAIVHYFDSADDDGCRVAALHLTRLGGISDWPEGFFDQYQLDVAALTRIRRPR